jgi:hypothetical protein
MLFIMFHDRLQQLFQGNLISKNQENDAAPRANGPGCGIVVMLQIRT